MALHTEPRDVFEAAARQHAVKVTCWNCKRTKVFDPHALWWLFERKGWNQSFKMIAERFRCQGCKRRGAAIELVREQPTGAQPVMPDQFEWKRAISRYRA